MSDFVNSHPYFSLVLVTLVLFFGWIPIAIVSGVLSIVIEFVFALIGEIVRIVARHISKEKSDE